MFNPEKLISGLEGVAGGKESPRSLVTYTLTVTLLLVGIVMLPLLYFVGHSTYDEFKAMRADLKEIVAGREATAREHADLNKTNALIQAHEKEEDEKLGVVQTAFSITQEREKKK